MASGVSDQTNYLATSLKGDQLDEFLDRHSHDYNALRHAVGRGVRPADVIALTLPDSYDIDRARDLLERGLAELSAVGLT